MRWNALTKVAPHPLRGIFRRTRTLMGSVMWSGIGTVMGSVLGSGTSCHLSDQMSCLSSSIISISYFQEQQHVPALESCPRRWQSLHLCLQELLWQVNDQDQNIVYDHLCRFESSKMLREHVNRVHRKGRNHEIDDLEGSNMRLIGSTFHSWITFFLFFRYQCEFPGCEREYGKKQHLKEHFRKHTGDRKHVTRKIQKCTISTYIAKTSVMNDAGDMRYSCDVCGERFFVHGHMKRHLYSHTGIKPHACRWTKRIFSTNNSSQVEVWSNICLVWWQNEARESAGDKINDQQEFGWLSTWNLWLVARQW